MLLLDEVWKMGKGKVHHAQDVWTIGDMLQINSCCECDRNKNVLTMLVVELMTCV